ncbi:MAG: GGDEF domain-containing protein [archaeon]
MNGYKGLDSIVRRLSYEGLSSESIKKEVSSLGNPNDLIYVGTEIWKNIFDRDWKCSSDTISFLRDIIHEANEKTKDLSTKDYLTGLSNRRCLDFELKKQLASTYRNLRNPFSVMMFDIDRFKAFNDTYGHNAGDVVLKTLSGVVSESIRDSDVAFRYGGEEFFVLLPNTKKADALDVAYRLKSHTEDTEVNFVDGRGNKHRKPVTVSSGVIEVNQENPLWFLYGASGKQLISDYVNDNPNFEGMLNNYFGWYSTNHSPVQREELTREEIRKRVGIIGNFVKSYVVENNSNIRDMSVAQCATNWIVKEVDGLMYYAKANGRNRVAYIGDDGKRTVEKLK